MRGLQGFDGPTAPSYQVNEPLVQELREQLRVLQDSQRQAPLHEALVRLDQAEGAAPPADKPTALISAGGAASVSEDLSGAREELSRAKEELSRAKEWSAELFSEKLKLEAELREAKAAVGAIQRHKSSSSDGGSLTPPPPLFGRKSKSMGRVGASRLKLSSLEGGLATDTQQQSSLTTPDADSTYSRPAVARRSDVMSPIIGNSINRLVVTWKPETFNDDAGKEGAWELERSALLQKMGQMEARLKVRG